VIDVIPPRLDAKLLYRRLDSLFGGLNPTLPLREGVERFLADAFLTLKYDLRLAAGFHYAEGRDAFEHVSTVGVPSGPAAESITRGTLPLTLLLQHRVYIFADPDAADAPFRHALLPRAPVAAVVVGSRPTRHVLFFLLADGWVREELDFTLNTVRAALGSRFLEERVRGSFRQAAEIQQSLLVEEPPEFPGFDLAARSVAAEEVGGDFYDFLSLEEDALMGLAIGDASGHGLPAALLVRDVVTGLRMGIEKNLKIAHVFSKLNRVIHRSNLSSRFISVFYGELEENGHVIYVNAGHPPPLVFSGARVIELSVGGTVIGPLPEVRFRRGVAYLEPGDVLVACTDGILERRNRKGEFFGDVGLKAAVEALPGASAHDVVAEIFARAFAFAEDRPWEDDATLLVVRRDPARA
jgi:hypothetical protein